MNQKIKNSYIFIKFALKNDEFARKNVDKNFLFVIIYLMMLNEGVEYGSRSRQIQR